MSDDYRKHFEDVPGIPYSNVDYDKIITGTRSTTRSCQYWVRGLPGICANWNGERCTYVGEGDPSGYNYGNCDFLGRRSSCNQYSCKKKLDPDTGEPTEENDEDLTEYMCVAPDPFRTGLIKEIKAGMPPRLTGQKTAVPKADVTGYNEDEEKGVGLCDGCGGGKGASGFVAAGERDTYKKLPVVCTYYRPWQMGFGAIKPKTTGKPQVDKDGKYVDEREELEQILPLSFKIYNFRAKAQKCQYWDRDYGSEFILDTSGLYLESDDEDRSDFCVCTDNLAIDYHTIDEEAFDDYPGYMLLENVWSKAGCVVCNGARPECPCYTGKWVCCVDEKMMDGDRFSAQQRMELRFWAHAWSSQKEYDEFFERRPGTNPDDPTTADIYTFTKWKKLGENASDSIMEGKKVHMCQPAPLNKREFIPDLYITETPIIYPKATIDRYGTSGPNEPTFPTLVRDLEECVPKQLNVVYPYSCRDPQSIVICEDRTDESDFCIKKSNSMDGDSIRIIGQTVRDRYVYAFNNYYVKSTLEEFDKYSSAFIIPYDEREKFFEKLIVLMENIDRLQPEYICKGVSVPSVGSNSGIFNIGPLSLEYQQLNEIIVCVDFGDGTWEFETRCVWSQWYGGAVVQTSFIHEYGKEGTSTNALPYYFSPKASAAGKLIPIGIEAYDCYTVAVDVFSVHSYRHYSILGDNKDSYSYCIKKITESSVEVNTWGKIGNSSLLWVEIDDINLNYIFEWEITKAVMEYVGEGELLAELIEMCVVFPTSWEEQQKTIPPNVCILEPKDGKPRSFFNTDWELSVDYEYTKLDTNNDEFTNEEIIWPVFDQYTTFLNSPFKVIKGDKGSFSIEDISRGTVAVMGYFTDEEGRLISAVATKMLVNVIRVDCRGVEIFYKYSAGAKSFLLQPSSGFRTWRGADKATGGTPTHVYTPKCGDHKCTPGNCIGPMWYPFNNCATIDYYSIYTAGVSCTMAIEGPEVSYKPSRSDYRYCGPYLYDAWVAPGGNWLSTCGVMWRCYYSNAADSPVMFTGYANIMGVIDVSYYNAMGWALPPFGNMGREITRKFLSQDFQSHIVYNTYPPSVKAQWMPLVPDNPSFFVTFNSFEQLSGGGDYVAPDYFTHVNQFNFFTLNGINEKMDVETRKRFEGVFVERANAGCSYPPPVRGESTVDYYCFKNESDVWVWREYWKSIEREDVENRLCFLQAVRPEYKYNFYKKEYRYICDEGQHILIYTAPVVEEGKYVTHPSVSLDGNFPRYFNVLYEEDDYGGGYVDWMDENVGEVDGSGGEDEESIYEETKGPKWNHLKPSDGGGALLFDSEAAETIEEAKDADREIVIGVDIFGEEIKKYFNRGIIVDITKDRLNYLPYKETYIDVSINIDPGIWYNESHTIEIQNLGYVCINRIVIFGTWGELLEPIDTEHPKACKPGIVVTSMGYTGSEVLYESDAEDYVGDGYEEFEIELIFKPTPIKMLKKGTGILRIKLIPSYRKHIKVGKIGLYEATYVDKMEIITTWERLYLSSSMSDQSPNLNGPEKILSYDPDMENAGQYFPKGRNGICTAMDKMRAVYTNEPHSMGTEESIPITYDTLHKIEDAEQEKLYVTAYDLDESGDLLIYSVVCPPGISEFFDKYGIHFFGPRVAGFKTEKLSWKKHTLSNSLVQFDYWRPGGHKFQWSDTTYKVKCMVLSFKMDDLYDTFLVHVHHGIGTQLVWDPGNALYTGRYKHIEALYNRAAMSGQDAPEDTPWSWSGGGIIP